MFDSTVAIIGMGVVGITTAYCLNNVNKILIDTEEGITRFNERQMELLGTRLNPGNYVLDTDLEGLEADIYILCLPTPLHGTYRTLDTSLLEEYLKVIPDDKIVVIRSTVPMGYFQTVIKAYPHLHFSYMPEFLREARAYEDSQFPDYLVVGGVCDREFLSFFIKAHTSIHYVSLVEAEIIKLSMNAYLSTRLTFFKELDRYCQSTELKSSARIIHALRADKRVGIEYSEPPYLVAGKCLPKDLIAFASKTKSPFFQSIVNLFSINKT